MRTSFTLLQVSVAWAVEVGARVDVYLPGGLTHPYLLCNNSTESPRCLIGVLRDPASRAGSNAMHDQEFLACPVSRSVRRTGQGRSRTCA